MSILLLKLPKDLSDFLKALPTRLRSKAGQSVNWDEFSKILDEANPREKFLIETSGQSLNIGRLPGQLVILTAGECCAGKSFLQAFLQEESRTINVYPIEKICVYVRKTISRVSDFSYKQKIKVIDIPVTLFNESNQEKCLELLMSVKKDINRQRPVKNNCGFKYLIRSHVYPNLVLLFISGLDKRLEGKESNFYKSLKYLEVAGVVDSVKVNLIVVITNSVSARLQENDMQRMSKTVTSSVQSVFKIPEVKVLFLDNEEGIQNLEYHNKKLVEIREKFQSTFSKSLDVLATTFFNQIFSGPTYKEKEWKHKNTLNSRTIQQAIQKLRVKSFNYIGHGYCLRTEMIKDKIMKPNNFVEDSLLDNFIVNLPSYVRFIPGSTFKVNRLTFPSKSTYGQNKILEYGLDLPGTELIVDITSRGRWNEDEEICIVETEDFQEVIIEESQPRKHYSFRANQILGKFEVDFMNGFANKKFVNDIQTFANFLAQKFPNGYYDSYMELFNKWGTHCITEVNYGGCMRIDFEISLSKSDVEEKLLDYMYEQIRRKLTENPNCDSELIWNGKKIENLLITVNSGLTTLPTPKTWEELNPDFISKWRAETQKNAIELEDDMKLAPLSDLIASSPEIAVNLKIATTEYLTGKIKDRRSTYTYRLMNCDIL